MRFFLTLLLLTPFAISSQDEPLYEQLINNVPAEGEERTVYLGDRMLTQRHGQFKDALSQERIYQLSLEEPDMNS